MKSKLDDVLVVSVLFAALAAGCTAGSSSAAEQEKRGAEQKGAGAPAADGAGAAKGVPVRVAEVTEERIPLSIEISGSLASPEDSAIAAEVEGKIARINVDLGDRVKQGQVLAQINPDEFRFRMDQADAQSEQAEANLKRVDKLAKTEMVSQQQLDDARFVSKQAKAAADLARKKFQDAEVRAPFNGAVSKRTVSLGEYVKVGQQLFQVVVLDQLKLTGEVPERFLSSVQVGDQVSAEVQAYPGQPFTGQVSRVSPAVNPNSRAFTVEARISNKDGRLRPGLFSRAKLSVGVEEHATIVPEAAVSIFAGVSRVYKIEKDVAREIRVDVVEHLPDGRLVLAAKSGLAAGDRVAVEGLARLAEGVEVQVR